MAIDFPASPTNGQTFTSGALVYTYDGTKWTAQPAGVTGGTKIEVGNTKAEIVDTGSDGRFVVTTEGSERLRCDSDGRLLVGTSSSLEANALVQSYKSSGGTILLNQAGSLANGEVCSTQNTSGNRSANIGLYKHSGITNPCAYLYLQKEEAGNAFYWTDNSGNFRVSIDAAHIGTTSGTVVGTQTSDERIKNLLGPVTYGLDEIKQLDPVSYALKSDPEQVPHLGFIAQQVNPIIPESVFDTDEEIEEGEPTKLGMEYVALIPVLVNAIKELSAEVDALKAQLQPQ